MQTLSTVILESIISKPQLPMAYSRKKTNRGKQGVEDLKFPANFLELTKSKVEFPGRGQ